MGLPIHQQLQAKRLAANLSQQQVATLAGLRQATISAIEAGHDVKLSSIEKLASALGVSLVIVNPLYRLPADFRKRKNEEQRVFLRQAAPIDPFRNTRIRVPSTPWSESL